MLYYTLTFIVDGQHHQTKLRKVEHPQEVLEEARSFIERSTKNIETNYGDQQVDSREAGGFYVRSASRP